MNGDSSDNGVHMLPLHFVDRYRKSPVKNYITLIVNYELPQLMITFGIYDKRKILIPDYNHNAEVVICWYLHVFSHILFVF